MAYRAKFVIAIVSAAVAFYAISGVLFGWSGTSAQQPINDPGAQIRIFESVLQHIQNDYVDEPDLEKVRNGAMRGLANGLDPYSSYLSAEQVRDFNSNTENKDVGIGAEFSQVSSYLYIVSVTKGSSAEKAGLKSGDVIEYIGTAATRDISLYDAEQLIRGAAGSKIKLRVLRSRAKPLTVEATREKLKVPAPSVEVKNGVAHLKVNSLAKGNGAAVRKEISNLNGKGISKVVLDLRSVAGGDIQDAVDVANAFIKSGKIATVVGREKRVLRSYDAAAEKHLFDGEVVALVDLGTAGTGEVIASAFLASKRGEVVGEKTFGAGVEQQLFTLSGGDGFLLTKAKWAAPDGRPFLAEKRADRGVKPSVEVKRPETPEPVEVEELVEGQEDEDDQQEIVEPAKKPQEDVQLKKALELLSGGKAKAVGAK
ncbi:MAG: PDZ domain-containing protein [Pyrinomonadaceae bacterium]|nr:PDZ domain-containing protein [Pyrinomonadaceae bacterium]